MFKNNQEDLGDLTHSNTIIQSTRWPHIRPFCICLSPFTNLTFLSLIHSASLVLLWYQ